MNQKDPVLVKFGRKLKKMRQHAKISQNQLAIELGYTTAQFVSNWERGLISPPIETLKTLEKLFETDLEVYDAWADHMNAKMQRHLTSWSKI